MTVDFGWILSIGAILGFTTMLIHSLIFNPHRKTWFIFGGGLIISFLLEYTLSIILHAYDYKNLPLTLFHIPIAIPFGWIITFYGLYNISVDLELPLINDEQYNLVILTGILGGFFGLGIESLARKADFWDFHFASVKRAGIPVVVVIVWSLTTSNFVMGIQLFEKYPSRWYAILLLIHGINLIIGVISLQFT